MVERRAHVVCIIACLAAIASADGATLNQGPTAGGNAESAQLRSAAGKINLNLSGINSSGPACSDLIVGFYVQNYSASGAQFIGSVAAADHPAAIGSDSAACEYTFSSSRHFARPKRLRRWFAVVNQRGPLDFAAGCYLQGYADLGAFEVSAVRTVDITLTESCPDKTLNPGNGSEI